jgi:hypothetical protein
LGQRPDGEPAFGRRKANDVDVIVLAGTIGIGKRRPVPPIVWQTEFSAKPRVDLGAFAFCVREHECAAARYAPAQFCR